MFAWWLRTKQISLLQERRFWSRRWEGDIWYDGAVGIDDDDDHDDHDDGDDDGDDDDDDDGDDDGDNDDVAWWYLSLHCCCPWQ